MRRKILLVTTLVLAGIAAQKVARVIRDNDPNGYGQPATSGPYNGYGGT